MADFDPKFNTSEIPGVLKRIGFEEATKITDTLQGSIWRASKPINECGQIETSVIKITNQFLHKHSMSVVGNKIYAVSEDILLETSILKYLQQQENCAKSMVTCEQFFRTDTAYYLVMSDGGNSLFEFMQKAHQLIRAGKIEISHWKNVCKIIFKQMLECIQFLHSHNVCHFDISCENFLINDVPIEIVAECGDTQQHKIRFLTDDIQLRLCDFGLAQLFMDKKCLSDKYVGKANYKSPEVANESKKFNARQNDIWCVGVCLWMILTGSNLWNVAEISDVIFAYIINGHLGFLVENWNMQSYVDRDVIHLFESIFQYEQHRVCLNKIKEHTWLS